MKTVIKDCSCEHKYQDETYGKNKRVHNECKGGNKYRCTVCKAEK